MRCAGEGACPCRRGELERGWRTLPATGACTQPRTRRVGVSSDSRGPGALIRRDTWRFPAARGERRGGMDWFSSRAPYLVLQCNEIFTTRLSTLGPVAAACTCRSRCTGGEFTVPSTRLGPSPLNHESWTRERGGLERPPFATRHCRGETASRALLSVRLTKAPSRAI